MMAIVRWNPNRHWLNLRDEMSRVFEDFFGSATKEGEDVVWAPRVDISETAEEFRVRAELPGVCADCINVDIENNTLIIQGEKQKEETDGQENFYRVERLYGRFMRSFTLPQRVKADQVKARYKDGILHIAIPKAEEAKPRQIQVEVE
jgi:HSP20 family protein